MLFVYKNVSQKNSFCIWMRITMTAIIERQRARLYTKNEKNCEKFLYTKSHTLFKKLDNFRYVFVYKKPYTWRYGIFMKFLKLACIYKSMTLCVKWRFYIKKARHFAKSKTICDTILYTKIRNFCVTQYLIESWNLPRGGGAFIRWKQCTLRDIFILKNNALCVTLLHTKSLTLCVTF